MNILFKILNPIMKVILRSRFHGLLSGQIMIITFTGRRSGKQFSTPVSYYQDGALVICATHSTWWKNIGERPEVSLRIRGKEVHGQAVAIPDDLGLKSELLYSLLAAVPSDAAFYGIKLGEDRKPILSDVEKAAADAVVIKITLADPEALEA